MYARWGFGAGSGAAFGVAVASQKLGFCRMHLKVGLKDAGSLPASFGHSSVGELQQGGILRYDCDSQKCDIALRTIPLRTFGVDSYNHIPPGWV